jgi:hypothetical protein
VAVRTNDEPFILFIWRVGLFGEKNSLNKRIVKLALGKSGHRLPEKEHIEMLGTLAPIHINSIDLNSWLNISEEVPTYLERDLKYRGLLTNNTSYQAELMGVLLGV